MTFDSITRWTERRAGSPLTFALACISVLLWACSGPFFHWSDTWQLIINTTTGITTFLMVFLIQGAGSRDMQAVQAKLDELIRVKKEARNELISVEEQTAADIQKLKNTVE